MAQVLRDPVADRLDLADLVARIARLGQDLVRAQAQLPHGRRAEVLRHIVRQQHRRDEGRGTVQDARLAFAGRRKPQAHCRQQHPWDAQTVEKARRHDG